MRRRTTFRPDALGPLEDRCAPSTLNPAHVSAATRIVVFGPQVHPTFVTKAANSTKLRVHHSSHKDGLRFLTREVAPTAQQVAAGANPNLYAFRIAYRNETTAIGTASIITFLQPKLTYVAGSEQSPAGTEFTVTETAKGVQVLRWFLPSGIGPLTTGFVTYQATLSD